MRGARIWTGAESFLLRVHDSGRDAPLPNAPFFAMPLFASC